MTVTDSVPGRMLLMGTRGSALARTQTQQVADQLSDWLPEVEITSQIIRTEGDVTTGSLASLGGTGVFAAALRTAVVQGQVDLAVHSLKDLPAIQPESLRIAAVPVRADPRDALCARDGMRLDEPRQGPVLGPAHPGAWRNCSTTGPICNRSISVAMSPPAWRGWSATNTTTTTHRPLPDRTVAIWTRLS